MPPKVWVRSGNNSELALCTLPSLSTISQNIKTRRYACAYLLGALAALDNQGAFGQRTYYPTIWILQGSV